MRNIKLAINFLLALIINILTFYKKKNIILIGGHHGNLYTDNSRVFYEYLLNKKKVKDVYWVLNKGSKADKDNINHSNKVYRGSIKNYLYMMRAKYVVVSHSYSDAIPVFYRFKKLFSFKGILINHGVYGFKKAFNKKGYFTNFDIITCVGEREKEFKYNHLELSPHIFKITGLARFDKLSLNEINKEKSILMMLTWRGNLTEKNINSSQYYNNIKSLLKNEKLLDYLKEKSIKLNVITHDKLQLFVNYENQEFDDAINILRNVDIQEELIKNSLLITDYSSVSWDFAYMNKPVVFYQFDLDDYLLERGSYLDLKTDLFGDVAYDENNLVELLIERINNNFEVKEEHLEMTNDYFKYKDKNNCDRIYKLLK